jgi:hypothetical protein
LEPELHVARYHSYLSARDAEPWHTFLMYLSLVYIPHLVLYWPIHTIYVATTLLPICPISLADVNVLVVLLNTSSHKIGTDSSPADLWCYFCIGLEIRKQISLDKNCTIFFIIFSCIAFLVSIKRKKLIDKAIKKTDW